MFWALHTWRLSFPTSLLSLCETVMFTAWVNMSQGCHQSPSVLILSSIVWGGLCSFRGSVEGADWDQRVWAAKKRSENEDQRLSLPPCTLQTFHSFISRRQQGMTLREALSAKYPFMEVVVKTQRPLIGGARMKPGCKSPECWLDTVDRCLGSVRFCIPK